MIDNELHIAIVQQNIFWEDKNANFERLEKLFAQIDQSVDLVILPETFNTGFSPNAKGLAEPDNGPTFQWMKKWAEKLSSVIMGSWYTIDNGQVFNRLFCISSKGLWNYYNKRHTFRLSSESKDVTCGNHTMTVKIDDWKIQPFVCYDLRFPVWTRNHFSNNHFQYDIAVFIANWPATRAKAWQRLLQARSIENQCYTIGVNRMGTDALGTPHSGNSMVISPNGNIIHQLDENNEMVKVLKLSYSNLERYRNKYPFHLDWDEFNIN